MTPLRDLLARCEKAAGPDRELDLALARGLGQDVVVSRQRRGHAGRIEDFSYWEYTGRIDDALHLIEELLPGSNWIIARGRTRPDEPLYGAQILREGPIRDEVIGEWELEASAALALVCALLKSLIAGEEKGRG